MVQPTDQDIMAIEKTVTHSSQEQGAHHTMGGGGGDLWGSMKVGQEAKGSLKITWQEPLLWFLCEGTGETGLV